MNFEVSVLETPEQVQAALPEWLAFLETRPLGMSVYNDPRFILNHWKYKTKESESRLYCVLVRESGRIVCVAPLSFSQKKIHLTLSIKKIFSRTIQQLSCFGDSFVYSNQIDEPKKVFDTVFENLKASEAKFDIFHIMDLRFGNPFWNYCTTNLKKGKFLLFNVLAEPQWDHRIILPETMDALMASLDKKKRYSVKRSVKNFHFDDQKDKLTCITEPDQVEFFVNAMESVAQESWQSKSMGHIHRDTEQNRSYFKELAQLGLLRSYVLERNGTPIAYRNGYQDSIGYYCQESRYDRTNHEKEYPGLVCLYFHIEDLYKKNKPQFVDFGFGDLGYKRIWANEEIESTTVYITASAKGAFLARTQRAINRFVDKSKKLFDRLGIADKIRKILKHKT